jgi:mannose-6-phosphate isomerase-like protein (cupin superfamily)
MLREYLLMLGNSLIVKKYNLSAMVKGWFIGPFSPTLCNTQDFECAVKRYRAGEREAAHFHQVATEYTVIAEGAVKMNGVVYERDSIIEIKPGEVTDFEAITDVITFVVKIPAVAGDKYSA